MQSSTTRGRVQECKKGAGNLLPCCTQRRGPFDEGDDRGNKRGHGVLQQCGVIATCKDHPLLVGSSQRCKKACLRGGRGQWIAFTLYQQGWHSDLCGVERIELIQVAPVCSNRIGSQRCVHVGIDQNLRRHCRRNEIAGRVGTCGSDTRWRDWCVGYW